MSNAQAGIFANIGIAMAGVLAKRLNDLGQLDEATLSHLSDLLDLADQDLPEADASALRILANIRLWLRQPG